MEEYYPKLEEVGFAWRGECGMNPECMSREECSLITLFVVKRHRTSGSKERQETAPSTVQHYELPDLEEGGGPSNNEVMAVSEEMMDHSGEEEDDTLLKAAASAAV